MGWIFILLGVFLIGTGSFLVYYGQDLVHRDNESHSTVTTETIQEAKRVLSPIHERLLRMLLDYQRRFAVHKLIIGRDGKLYFDAESPHREANVSVIADLFGINKGDQSKARDLELLIEQMPDEYLRRLPESRLGNPFVIAVSEEGIKYLRGK